MSAIVIGKSEGENIAIDRKVLMTTRLLIIADSGGGKTWLLKRLIEQSFGQAGIIIIDPEGEFAPLRTKLDFFLVGKGGDTPADIRTAEKVAHTLLSGRASAICDIYDMKDSERHIWVQRFLDALLNAPKELRSPYFVIVDEAHMFCPEHGKGESVASDSMRGLAGRGRKRLLCGMFASQRAALLSKDLTGMCLNRLVGPTFESVNQKRAAEELGILKGQEEKEFRAKIKMLDPGYFYALGRAITKELKLVHVGPIETPHGHEALKYELKPPPPSEKVREWLAKLGDLPKQAEEEARTTADFKKQIRELKAQLRNGPNAAAAPAKIDQRAIDRAIDAANRGSIRSLAAYRRAIEEAMKIIAKVNAYGFEGKVEPAEISKALQKAGDEITRIASANLARREKEFESLKAETRNVLARMRKLIENEQVTVNVDLQKREPIIAAPTKPPSRAHAENNGHLPPRQSDILRALVCWENLGEAQPLRAQVAALARVSARSSGFDKNVSTLKTAGLIDYAVGRILLTGEGRAAAPPSEMLSTSEEILDFCVGVVSRPQGEILKQLHALGGEFVGRAKLAELSGQSATSSGFDKNVSTLRSAGMVEYGSGTVKCADWLFI